MAETFKQILTKEQLDSGIIPQNAVLVEMIHTSEGIKSKGGVILGVCTDEEYDDETTSHVADLAEVYGRVYKLPDKLYYNKDGTGMPWDCDMELRIGDLVWFNAMESKNAVEIVCEDKLYKLLPYQDMYCSKRLHNYPSSITLRYISGVDPWYEVVMLNGYVLLEPLYLENKSFLAVDKKGDIDKTKGIVRFVGKPNKEYIRPEYIDFLNLNAGDVVLLNPGTPIVYLERKKYLATFLGDELFFVVQRRKIALILSKGN